MMLVGIGEGITVFLLRPGLLEERTKKKKINKEGGEKRVKEEKLGDVIKHVGFLFVFFFFFFSSSF